MLKQLFSELEELVIILLKNNNYKIFILMHTKKIGLEIP
jgi:hypothetical protein